MASNYTGDPSAFTSTIVLPDIGDRRNPTSVNSPFQQLADNDAYLRDQNKRGELRAAVLKFRVLTLSDTLDDAGDFMGVAQPLNKPFDVVELVKAGTNDVFSVVSGEQRAFATGGDVPSITSAIREAVDNGSRLVVIGTGGNLNAYSDNLGASWTAGTAGVGGAVQYLVWSPANALAGGGGLWISGGSGTGSTYHTTNPASIVWTSAASAFAAVQGLAVLGGTTANKGYVVALGDDSGGVGTQPRFSVSTDNGLNYSGTQQPPSAALADEPGSIAGAPAVPTVGAAVYHVMRAGSFLRTAKTIDGLTWTSGTTIAAPGGGVTFDGRPRLMICQNSGLQVIAVPVSVGGGSIAVYASRDFSTWVGPEIVTAGGVGAFGVAGGRVFYTSGSSIMASDGLGAGVLA